MNIVELPTMDLVPYENNPRNNEEAVDRVAESINKFGFKVPIVVTKRSKIKSRTRYTKLHIDKVVLAEEALTRVQEKLIKAVETKHKMERELAKGMEDKELNITIMPGKARG